MRYLVIFALVGLAACAPRQFQGPNGRTAFTVICPPGNTGICFQKIAPLCPNGYEVIDNSAGTTGPQTISAECR